MNYDQLILKDDIEKVSQHIDHLSRKIDSMESTLTEIQVLLKDLKKNS